MTSREPPRHQGPPVAVRSDREALADYLAWGFITPSGNAAEPDPRDWGGLPAPVISIFVLH